MGKWFIDENGLDLEMTMIQNATTTDLKQVLQQSNSVVIVSVTFTSSKAPSLTSGSKAYTVDSNVIGGHMMVLGAFDPNNRKTPWGFVNSWVNGTDNLFWMSNNDLVGTLGVLSKNDAIILSSTSP
jgi:hypothetical protein